MYLHEVGKHDADHHEFVNNLEKVWTCQHAVLQTTVEKVSVKCQHVIQVWYLNITRSISSIISSCINIIISTTIIIISSSSSINIIISTTIIIISSSSSSSINMLIYSRCTLIVSITKSTSLKIVHFFIYSVILFLERWSNYDQTPFLASPVAHIWHVRRGCTLS